MRTPMLIAILGLPVLIACAEAPIDNATTGVTVGGAVANTVPAQATAETGTPAYLATAASSDLYEIQSSQMAAKAGVSAPVQDFARMMIDHHTKTTTDLTAAARAAGMTPPPPALLPKHEQLLSQLRGQQGAAFERAYLTQQTQAHQEALALHQGYASQGETPAIRKAAEKTVPIVQKHLERVQQLAATGG